MIGRSIRHGLSNLFRFTGRDDHGLFWPYAVTVVSLSLTAGMAAVLPIFFGAMRRAAAFARTHPDRATITEGPGHVAVQIDGPVPDLFVGFQTMVVGMGVVIGLTALLLAAAITRRLHDTGRSGWWAFPTALFLGIGLAAMLVILEEETPSGLFLLLFLNNLLYLGALGMLIVLLLLGGTQGENRYGARPAG